MSLFDRASRSWPSGLAALGLAIALVIAGPTRPGLADDITVAVAANFTAPAKEIAAAFAAATGHQATLSFGSTGQFFAQIGQGAPFDVFLAADQARPTAAEDQGLAVAGSRFTYAIGTLVLWSRSPDLVTGPDSLSSATFAKLALANPATAPYGAAAVQVLTALGIHEAVAPRLVQGNSIAQTFQFVDTGNADLGFVAGSQLVGVETGSRWVVDPTLYDPIRQDAVLLTPAADKPAARAFLAYLQGPEARAIIASYGYALAD